MLNCVVLGSAGRIHTDSQTLSAEIEGGGDLELSGFSVSYVDLKGAVPSGLTSRIVKHAILPSPPNQILLIHCYGFVVAESWGSNVGPSW